MRSATPVSLFAVTGDSHNKCEQQRQCRGVVLAATVKRSRQGAQSQEAAAAVAAAPAVATAPSVWLWVWLCRADTVGLSGASPPPPQATAVSDPISIASVVVWCRQLCGRRSRQGALSPSMTAIASESRGGGGVCGDCAFSVDGTFCIVAGISQQVHLSRAT